MKKVKKKTENTENKKVKGATPVEYNGIKFKSTLEKRLYIHMLKLGIKPLYEANKYVLSEKVIPKVPFFNRTKRKTFHKIMSPIREVTYTPDFEFLYGAVWCIIEAKGKENDVFPFKRNLFRKMLETWDSPVAYFEVRTIRELNQALDFIKELNDMIDEKASTNEEDV